LKVQWALQITLPFNCLTHAIRKPLTVLFAFSFLRYSSNFAMYIVQQGADSASSTVGAYTMHI